MKAAQQVTEEQAAADARPTAARQVTYAQDEDYWIFGVSDIRGVRSKKDAVVLDSGAELHVCPEHFHDKNGILPKVPGRDLVVIGGDTLNYKGERKVFTTLCNDNQTTVPAVVNFAVADVTNPGRWA